jgi:hypothetical protein
MHAPVKRFLPAPATNPAMAPKALTRGIFDTLDNPGTARQGKCGIAQSQTKKVFPVKIRRSQQAKQS